MKFKSQGNEKMRFFPMRPTMLKISEVKILLLLNTKIYKNFVESKVMAEKVQ